MEKSTSISNLELSESNSINNNVVKNNSQIHAAPWERKILFILLILTAFTYIWGLNQSEWSNSFYSAAVQAGTKSWKAFFFGSIDASNFITVDKPPASLWIMELSARIFGLNSWSILVPEALEGIACVWVLYMTIRRWFSPLAALLAGLILAITPVAALMFRFNNPDALLVLLLTASAYFFTRALEKGKTKWLVIASVLIGFGFLTKMLAAFFVIPSFVLVYLIFAPVSVRRRIVQIIISAITVLVSAGWWVAIVQLIPAAERPYIGSSQKNSILNLIFGYNGFGRLTGNESGMGGHGGGGMFGGNIGFTRLFESEMGGQISWLIPAAIILFGFSIWFLHRNWKKDRAFSSLLMWALIFFITGIVFSFGKGVIHQYYTVALAPAIGALIGISVDVIWPRRDEGVARIGLTLAILSTALWSFFLLERSSNWLPWLRVVILVIGIVAGLGIAFGPRLGQRLFKGTIVVALVSCLAGPLAYTIQTVMTPHTGSTPTAGPAVSNGRFNGNFRGQQGSSRFNLSSTASGGAQMPNFDGSNPSFNKEEFSNIKPGGFSGGFGGENRTVSSAIVTLLEKNASQYTWIAATVGSQSSAPYQLATGDPVMDIGGFSGSDPTPTLAQFKKLVSEGQIHYYINGGRASGRGFNHMNGDFSSLDTKNASNENMKNSNNSGSSTKNPQNHSVSNPGTSNNESPNSYVQGGPMGGGFGANSAIANWVEQNFESKTVGGVTLYDLTQPKS